MTRIELVANDQLLQVTVSPKISSGEVNTVGIHVDFSDEWNNFGKNAVFYTSYNSRDIYEIVMTNDECIVPSEVMKKSGTLYIGIRGVNSEKNEVKTTSLVKLKISEGTPTGNSTEVEPTPDVYQQLLTAYGKTDNSINKEKAERQAEIAVERARIDNISTLTEGSTTADAELLDIRVKADGTTASSAGNAVREQFSELKGDLQEVADSITGINNSLIYLHDEVSFNEEQDGFVNIYSEFRTDGIRKHIDVTLNKGDTIKAFVNGRTTGCSIFAYKYPNGAYSALVNSRSANVELYEYTSTFNGTITITVSYDPTVHHSVKIDRHDIERITDKVDSIFGINVSVDFTSGASNYDTNFTVTTGNSYIISNPNDLKVVVFVKDHQEVGEYVTLQANSSVVFDAKYDGILRFYKLAGDNTRYNVIIKRQIVKPTTKEYSCTVSTGFYNAIKDMAKEEDGTYKILYVNEGDYDLFTEIGSVEYANEITDYNNWEDDNIIIPPNTKIIGVGKVVLKMNIDASSLASQSQATNSLSPLNIVKNCEIENIIIECNSCRYGIHIEGSGRTQNNNQTFSLKNVYVKFSGTVYGFGSDIGIGLNKGCTLNVDDCIFSTEKGFGIGGHLNNGIAIVNVNSTAINSARQSFSISNHINARQGDSVFTFNNSVIPSVHVGNNDSIVYNNLKYIFVRTDTTITKDENTGTVIHEDYGCTVVEDY